MAGPTEVLNRSTEEKRTLEMRFHTLADQWKRETIFLSNPTAMAQHPAYQEIIHMGADAVPLILADLSREPDFWFTALRELTGVNPVTAEIRGKVLLIAEAWLKWGREHGYEC